MKKLPALALLLLGLFPLSAQDFSGIGKWITGFPGGGSTFADHPITAAAVEPTGAYIAFIRGETTVRINVIAPIGLDALTEKYRQAERAVLSGLAGDRWRVAVKACEIDIGPEGDTTVTLIITSFRFRLDQESELEFVSRLEADPVFHSLPGGGFSYTLRFRGVASGTGNGDGFPGWAECAGRTARRMEEGIKAKDREILAIVLDTKIMSSADRKVQTRIVLTKDTRSSLWLGMNIAYLMPGLVSGESLSIVAHPFTCNLLLSSLYLSWRNLGDPAWLVKPYGFTVSLGAFCEFNVGWFAQEAAGYYSWTTSPISGMLAFGPALGVEFSAMIPKIVDNRYYGDLFGLGVELLAVFNLPYFLPEYEYAYFLTVFLNIVCHVLPVRETGVDVIVGFNFSLATAGYAETGAVTFDRFGVTIGARLKLDFQNLSPGDRLFD
jgi:hypothetical protein